MAEVPAETIARERREKVQEIGDRFLPEWIVTKIKQAILEAYEAGRADERKERAW